MIRWVALGDRAEARRPLCAGPGCAACSAAALRPRYGARRAARQRRMQRLGVELLGVQVEPRQRLPARASPRRIIRVGSTAQYEAPPTGSRPRRPRHTATGNSHSVPPATRIGLGPRSSRETRWPAIGESCSARVIGKPLLDQHFVRPGARVGDREGRRAIAERSLTGQLEDRLARLLEILRELLAGLGVHETVPVAVAARFRGLAARPRRAVRDGLVR